MDEFISSSFMPHGHCYFWRPEIVWTHAIADSIIALAYFVIPLTLVHIVRRRKDFTYIWLGLLFAVFILGCGTTHIFDVVNIWQPWYKTDAIVRIVTALASIGTALVLIRLTPKILVIPSASQWKQVNEELLSSNTNLLKSNEDLTKTEQILKELNADLEERVKARSEEALKKAEEFKFLADAIPQLVWTCDESGKVSYVNERWCQYTGLTKDQSLGDGWSNIIHPLHLEETWKEWNACVALGTEFKMEHCLRSQDGSYHWFLSNGIPMKDKDGNVVQWFGTSTDIQEQKVQTKELEAKNNDLRRINNDLDNFIYTASHDLKAPISNMEGLLNTIYDDLKVECSEDMHHLFSMLETSILRLKNTIQDLTDISRVQKNLQDNIEPIVVEEILDEYKENHKEQLVQHDTTIVADLDERVVHFSKKNFRSIVYNLVTNAIKYRDPNRKPLVNIRTLREGNYIVLTVEDNGLGLDVAQKEKVFGMFKRLHTHVEGSGVGLYIVNRIVENSNGRIEVDSELGKGSIFKVYFPDPVR